jgi:hypothetical protein
MIRLLCVCKEDGKPGLWFDCKPCGGDGKSDEDGRGTCPECHGEGLVPCGDCDGMGWVACNVEDYEPGTFVSCITSIEGRESHES